MAREQVRWDQGALHEPAAGRAALPRRQVGPDHRKATRQRCRLMALKPGLSLVFLLLSPGAFAQNVPPPPPPSPPAIDMAAEADHALPPVKTPPELAEPVPAATESSATPPAAVPVSEPAAVEAPPEPPAPTRPATGSRSTSRARTFNASPDLAERYGAWTVTRPSSDRPDNRILIIRTKPRDTVDDPTAAATKRFYAMDPALRRRYGLDRAAPTPGPSTASAETGGTSGTAAAGTTASGTPAFRPALMREDLTIMSRLIEKALEQEMEIMGGDAANRTLGIQISARDRLPQVTYLEGYGAIFVVSVPFPLIGPSAEPQPVKTESNNGAWEQTRRELYGSSKPDPFIGDPNLERLKSRYGVNLVGVGREASHPYDSEQVDRVKHSLLTVMKNAVNIRQMEPSELITIVLQGTAPALAGQEVETEPWPTPTGRTHLVLQANLDSLKAFAQDKTSADDFAKTASVLTY